MFDLDKSIIVILTASIRLTELHNYGMIMRSATMWISFKAPYSLFILTPHELGRMFSANGIVQ